MAKKKSASIAIAAASKLETRGRFAVDCRDWRVGTNIQGPHVLTGLFEKEAQRIAKERTWVYCKSCNAVRYAPESVCWKCRVPIKAESPV